MKSKLLSSIVFVGISFIVLLTNGCGGKNTVDDLKKTANTVKNTADKVTGIAGAALQIKDSTSYAKFMLLRPGMSSKAAMAAMVALPDKDSGMELFPHKVYAWKQDDGSVIACFFLGDKLFQKQYITTNITVKQPFTVEQFNEIRNGDSYDTVKRKLNNQDGYISSVSVIPENKQRDIKELEQTTYTWRNPDGTAVEIEIMDFMGIYGTAKKRMISPQTGAGNEVVKSGNQSNSESQKQTYSSNNTSNVQSISHGAISNATQSSFDNEDGYHHDATKTIDGDIKSCWAEGVKGLGIGEFIQVNFNGTYKVNGLNIWVGHQKSQDLFYKNARPVAIRIIGSDGTNEVYGLNDSMGMQRVNFRQPINSRYIRIVIEKVARGNKYEDTCIGEVSFF